MPPANKPATQTPETYIAALQLVQQIIARLAWGRPIIDKNGQRITELEDVIQAILKDSIDTEI